MQHEIYADTGGRVLCVDVDEWAGSGLVRALVAEVGDPGRQERQCRRLLRFRLEGGFLRLRPRQVDLNGVRARQLQDRGEVDRQRRPRNTRFGRRDLRALYCRRLIMGSGG